jgi:bidirectional [NiFe] hydrogenase diaphorase subunit
MGSCVRVCTAASCRSRGGKQLEQELAAAGANTPGLSVKEVGCFGPCSDGPLISTNVDGDEQGNSRLLALEQGVSQQVAQSLNLLATDPDLSHWNPPGSRAIHTDAPFLRLQRRLVLAQCGRIDPGCIDDALAAGAYEQLRRVLEQNSPEAVIDIVRRSGLRGRGGAGYPTGLKWATVAAMPSDTRWWCATPMKATRAPSWTAP